MQQDRLSLVWESPPTKKCTKCSQILPLEKYHRHSQMKDGRTSYCADCWKRVYGSKRKKVESKERSKRNALARYGLTPESMKDAAGKQDHKCAICLKPFGTNKSSRPHVDHCHKTGLVRGLLCQWCNLRLATVEDRNWCELAIQYLSDPPIKGVIGRKWRKK